MTWHHLRKVYAFILSLLPILHNGSSDVIDDFRQTCPYTDLCTSKGLQSNITDLPGVTPCCMDCYCDADCWKYNDCCIDAQQEVGVNTQQTKCAWPIVKNQAYHKGIDDDLRMFIPNYRMIDSCPRSYTGSQLIKDKCMEAFTGVPDFDDVVMVSNKDHHDEIYKNKHCASCNGVMDVVKWDLYVSFCEDGYDIGDGVEASAVSERIWDQCIIYSTPPNTLKFSRPLLDCGQHVISTCQTTSESHDGQLKYLCEKGSYTLVFLLRSNGIDIFKNPYCLLCSGKAGEYQDVCDADIVKLNSRRSGTSGDLTILLSGGLGYEPFTQPRVTDEDKQCNEDEIFDRVMEKCRKLYCPFNFVVFFGRCVRLGTTVSNAQVRLEVLFRPVSLAYFTDQTIQQLNIEKTETFITHIQELLEFERCEVTGLSAITLVRIEDQTLSFLAVNLVLPISNACPLDYITNNSRRIASESVRLGITLNNQQIRLIGRLNLADSVEDLAYDQTVSVYEMITLAFKSEVRKNPFTIKEKFICPSILLNITEYNTLMIRFGEENVSLNGIGHGARIKDGFFVMVNETIGVCTDTYFGLFENATSSTRTYVSLDCMKIAVFILMIQLTNQKLNIF